MCNNIKSLRLRVVALLEASGFKEKTILNYNRTWNLLEKFMESKGFVSYSSKIGQAFLEERHHSSKFSELTDFKKKQVRHIEVLNRMYEQGDICLSRRKSAFSFDVAGMEAFGGFLKFCSDKKSHATISEYRLRLRTFFTFLIKQGIKINDIEVFLVIQFLAELRRTKTTPVIRNTIRCMRVFFRYLCENKLLKESNIERWLKLLQQSPNAENKIPSVYTKEEINLILNAIDRKSPQGKRDYALFLLVVRYGFRAQDIVNLRFSNLSWENVSIKLRQSKNKKLVKVDLSEEVGEALIDYLKYGRPDINIPFVFITCRPPFKQLGRDALGTIIRRAVQMSGIKINGRKRGPHAFRHTLATNLLKEGETIPVIAEILGHSTTQSTMTYTRVDLEQLRKCALEVPLVSSTFYEGVYGKK